MAELAKRTPHRPVNAMTLVCLRYLCARQVRAFKSYKRETRRSKDGGTSLSPPTATTATAPERGARSPAYLNRLAAGVRSSRVYAGAVAERCGGGKAFAR